MISKAGPAIQGNLTPSTDTSCSGTKLGKEGHGNWLPFLYFSLTHAHTRAHRNMHTHMCTHRHMHTRARTGTHTRTHTKANYLACEPGSSDLSSKGSRGRIRQWTLTFPFSSCDNRASAHGRRSEATRAAELFPQRTHTVTPRHEPQFPAHISTSENIPTEQ